LRGNRKEFRSQESGVRILACLLGLSLLLAGCSKPAQQSSVFIDPALIALVSSDTTLLAGARVDGMAKTPAFQKLVLNPVIQDISGRTGVDPGKALWQLMFTSNGRRGLILARGKFSDELMAPDLTREGMERFGYKGLTMFGNSRESLVFFNSSTIALGDTNSLWRLIDERGSIKGLPARFVPMVKTIPADALLWGVFLGGNANLPVTGNLANLNNVLAMVQNGMFYATFDDKMHLTATLTALSDASAQDIQGALQTLMAMAKLQGQVIQEGTKLSVRLNVTL